MQEEPNHPLANYYLADILTDQKSYQEAIPRLQIAIPVYPKLKQAYFLLGKCYAGTGDSKRALEAFNEALKLDPDYKEVHYQLFGLYARLGDQEKSKAELRTFEKLIKEGQEEDKSRLKESVEKQSETKTHN